MTRAGEKLYGDFARTAEADRATWRRWRRHAAMLLLLVAVVVTALFGLG